MTDTMDLGENFSIIVDDTLETMAFSNSGSNLINITSDKSSFNVPIQIPEITVPPAAEPGSSLLYVNSGGDVVFTNSSGVSTNVGATGPVGPIGPTGPTGPTIFGNEFQSEELTTQLTTTTNTYITRQQMITPSLPAGLYRIEFLLLWRCNGASVSCGSRLFADTDQLFGGESFIQEAKDANDRQRSVFTGADVYDFAGGPLTITLQFNRDKGGGTAFTEYSRLTIWRVN